MLLAQTPIFVLIAPPPELYLEAPALAIADSLMLESPPVKLATIPASLAIIVQHVQAATQLSSEQWEQTSSAAV